MYTQPSEMLSTQQKSLHVDYWLGIMYYGCVQRALAVTRVPIFAFKACVMPSIVYSGTTSGAKCPGVVIIVADTRWHGPAAHWAPVGQTRRAGGPRGIASRSC